ncbi:hypothetical protein [Yersinia thracica]|uniref:hypothetical protein n=1 Tax=Yersinia thracica TaxID=2890319 RepID=UPI000A896932|nr:hypothetical protein [Yersinia thracica]
MSGQGRTRKARLGKDAHRAGSSARKTQEVYPQGNISRQRGIPQGCAPAPFGG